MYHDKPRLGLALGGGAVRGLAHIGLLKILDKHDIKPATISGTSMGAIIGALYASGLTGLEIEQRVREHLIEPGDKLKTIYKKRSKLVKWAKVFGYEKARGGLVKAEGLFTHLFDELIDTQFEQLDVPFTCIATDFHRGIEVALREGELLPAVLASMAVPGFFAPVQVQHEGENRTLVDGGLTNNLPTSHIQDCEIKFASDVMALPKKQDPKTLEVVNGAINIMVVNASRLSLHAHPVDLLIQPHAEGVDAFDFHKIDEVLKRGDEEAALHEAQILDLVQHRP